MFLSMMHFFNKGWWMFSICFLERYHRDKTEKRSNGEKEHDWKIIMIAKVDNLIDKNVGNVDEKAAVTEPYRSYLSRVELWNVHKKDLEYDDYHESKDDE